MRERVAAPLLREMAVAGATRTDAADRLSVGVERVTQLCRKYGITLRPAKTRSAPKPRRRAKLDQMVIECAEAGLTRRATAERLGVSYAAIIKAAQRSGAVFPHASKRADPRLEDMATLYLAGFTLQQVGDQYGLSRERVRQILTRRKGIRGTDGGFYAKAQARKARAREIHDGRFLAKHGCTVAQWRVLRDLGLEMQRQGVGPYRTPIRAFINQRNNAHRRGIGWDLTLWAWWQIWAASGHWAQRGRGQGYVMCRIGDEGPYAPGNVFIALAAENSSERRQKKSTLPRGVKIRHGKFAAVRQIGGKKYERHGFATPELAHAAYLRMGMAETAQTLAA